MSKACLLYTSAVDTGADDVTQGQAGLSGQPVQVFPFLRGQPHGEKFAFFLHLSLIHILVRKISAIMERRRREKEKEEILIQRVREAGRNGGGIVHIDDLQD